MPWDRCMLQFYTLECKTLVLFNQLWWWSEQSFTEKEQLACIQLFHMHLGR